MSLTAVAPFGGAMLVDVLEKSCQQVSGRGVVEALEGRHNRMKTKEVVMNYEVMFVAYVFWVKSTPVSFPPG